VPRFPSPFAQQIPRSRIREISELAVGVDGLLPLYFGESNVPTPDFINHAAKHAIDHGHTFYTHNAGYLDLRRAIADHTHRLHGLAYDPDGEIIVTAGGVAAIFLALHATLEPGSRAIIVSPCWPNVPAIVRMCGAQPIEVPLSTHAGRFTLDRQALADAIDPATRVLFVNSPSNPTGWLMTHDDQAFLIRLAADHGLCLLLDIVYERLVYDGSAVAPLPHVAAARDRIVLLHSLSKAYSMTGWRVGYALGPRPIIEQMTKLQEFVVSHAPAPSQRAALAAIQHGEPFVRQLQQRYRRLRDIACDRLARCPRIQLVPPQGAFYAFPRIQDLADSFHFCRRLLATTQVGLAPGSAFGPGGEAHVRLCFAVDDHILVPALDRLAHFLDHPPP